MELVYLNNAATSWPKAPQTGAVVAACIDKVPYHAGRSAFSGPNAAEECRHLLAALLQVKEPKQIVFGPNATYALNVALHGLRWKSDDAVVTTVAEHNSVLRPLHYLSKTKGIKIHMVPVDGAGRIIPEAWAEALKKFKPRVAVFTHASNVTGAINDAKKLAMMAKTVGAITLLDASQSLGAIPVYPEEWGIDLAAFTGHKYLLGPTGSGGLYVAPAMSAELEPVWVGGTGIQSELDEMPPMMPIRFEAGTSNDCALVGLASALRWAAEHRIKEDALLNMTQRLCTGLQEIGAEIIEVTSPRTPVVSFRLKGWDVEDVGEILQKSFGIVCRTGLHCAPQIHSFLGAAPRGTVRLSLSRFTTKAEVDYCLQAIGAILHEVG